ncbi:MAG: hypothetical protein R3310_18190, partial [Candidatus Competibacteraceae bacterium]|nr:hypothetical protein [Candidatus Competibacteraceae bacterium]
RFEIMDRHHDTGLSEDLPAVRVWSQALLEHPAVRESVVADFEQRFKRHFAGQNGLFGTYLV